MLIAVMRVVIVLGFIAGFLRDAHEHAVIQEMREADALGKNRKGIIRR